MAQLPSQSQFGDYGDWPGRDVLDSGGERLGGVREIYLDRETGRPEWVLVDVEGDEARFVPLADAAVEASAIRVAHLAIVVRSGPSIGPEPRIDQSQERLLYEHYGIGYSQEESGSGLPDPDQQPPADTAPAEEPGAASFAADAPPTASYTPEPPQTARFEDEPASSWSAAAPVDASPPAPVDASPPAPVDASPPAPVDAPSPAPDLPESPAAAERPFEPADAPAPFTPVPAPPSLDAEPPEPTLLSPPDPVPPTPAPLPPTPPAAVAPDPVAPPPPRAATPPPPPRAATPPGPEPSGGALAVLSTKRGRIAGAAGIAAVLFLIIRRLR
jgi:hypothetical protein